MISSYKGPNICAYSRIFLLQFVLPLTLSNERLKTLKPLIQMIGLLARKIYCKTDHVAAVRDSELHLYVYITARERAHVSLACTGAAVAAVDLTQSGK